MAAFVAQQTVKQLLRAGNPVRNAKIIILGLTFKENCSDLRNSKVAHVVRELQDFGCDVSVHDPVAIPDDAMHEYGISLISWEDLPEADAIIAAVSHKEFVSMLQTDLLAKLKPGGIFVDVKSAYDAFKIMAAGYRLWRL
jgi:UDP-N-acetyl-D-galactosamine dehydrogenase